MPGRATPGKAGTPFIKEKAKRQNSSNSISSAGSNGRRSILLEFQKRGASQPLFDPIQMTELNSKFVSKENMMINTETTV